ncbi:hypothetical protein TNCV_623521 [Trichonephila clavipes]|nr:hypothetical protein TNCV_623521 [Trichonephila clavipes]
MADLLPRNRVVQKTTSQRETPAKSFLVCVRLRQWMTVYFWVPGLINSPQSHIMMSVMQDLTSLVFSVCGMTCRRFGCGDGIREEGLRDDYLELKFYTVLRA